MSSRWSLNEVLERAQMGGRDRARRRLERAVAFDRHYASKPARAISPTCDLQFLLGASGCCASRHSAVNAGTGALWILHWRRRTISLGNRNFSPGAEVSRTAALGRLLEPTISSDTSIWTAETDALG